MPNIQSETEQLLDAALKLPRPELDKFVARLQSHRRQAAVPRLSQQESELLLKINQGIPEPLLQRYEALLKKRRRDKLTRAEQQELLALTRQIEQHDVARLNCLAALAQLRGLALPDLLQQLGIKTPEPEYD